MHTEAKAGVGVERHNGSWLGLYTDIRGRIAVVAEHCKTKKQAFEAAVSFEAEGRFEDAQATAGLVKRLTYKWEPDQKYDGRCAVYRENLTGDRVLIRQSR